MSVTLKVDAQVVEQGTPYLIELPSALKISDNGIFLGQELFLIEIKKQLAVIFLKNNFKKKYKVNDLEIIINAPKVRSEFFKEEIYLKKLSRDEKSLGLYFLGVTVFIIGTFFLYKSLVSKYVKNKKIKIIKKCVLENKYKFIMNSDEPCLGELKVFLKTNLYKKDWEKSYKNEFESLKKEFVDV
jgi:hypothetical protein